MLTRAGIFLGVLGFISDLFQIDIWKARKARRQKKKKKVSDEEASGRGHEK